MNYQITIKSNSSIAKHAQIAESMRGDIEAGRLQVGMQLPSINEFSKNHKVARDTIEKAYNILKKQGYILGVPGKGNYVAGGHEKSLKILMILNKMSSYKKEVYESFIETLGETAKVDLQIHHYNINLFREIVEESKGKYHYYVVMPHFFHQTPQEEYVKVLNEIPNAALVVLDKEVILDKKFINVFQDFEKDILDALLLKSELFEKYKGITLVFPKESHHPKEIINGIEAFSLAKKKQFKLVADVTKIIPTKGIAYVTLTENELATLVKKIRNTDLQLGVDIGILSFNETVLKELLGITVVSTNFSAMGRTAAEMILTKNILKVKNEFSFIKRQSL
ncbi:GntR family transcriptional regulator [Pedobacter sp. Du54]|uniref:GntR family transcriptional regulator n=1 Tax=Pedobacter anseongensis TaxID=3133439 RepID=UPI0030B14CC0